MTKRQTIKLFQKLFEPSARTRRNWREMINSLEKEEVLTPNQAQWRRMPSDFDDIKGFCDIK